MNQRLINETAFSMAASLLAIVQNCIRPEEQRDAFREFYDLCKTNLEAYQIQAERMLQRLKPSKN